MGKQLLETPARKFDSQGRKNGYRFDMRTLFIGSVQFSEKALEKLIQLDSEVVGVVTKQSSAFNSDFVDLSKVAEKHHIPSHHTNEVNSKASVDWIKGKNPDVIFCLGWSRLLKNQVLSIPPRGVIGYHPSKLPFNRGRHPLIWAIALGLEETASTYFLMDEGADTGDILSQESFPIYFSDRARDVYVRMTEVALAQLESLIEQLESDTLNRVSQHGKTGNTWRKRGEQDGKIDFRMSSENIYNLVRALDKPYDGAHFEYRGEAFTVWNVEIAEFSQKNLEPGKILEVQGRQMLVKTGNGAIRIKDHEMKKLPNKNEYLNNG